MIKPPAMGVFARDDPPPTSRSLAPHPSSSTSTTLPVKPEASDTTDSLTANQQDEGGQDDDQGTVDEEAGVIRCICACDDDDGFTIQCDRCLVWQHCACFGMSQASVPDEYLCEQCAPRPVDVAFAVAHQQKRKNNEARKALMERNLKKQAQALVSASYTQEYIAKEAASLSTMSSPSSTFPSTTDAADHPPVATHIPVLTNRSRKPSQALDLTNTQFVVPDLPASAGSNGRAAVGAPRQRKGQKGSRRRPDTPSAATTPSKGIFTPGSTTEKYDDPFDLAEQLEAWHVEFTPISKNVVADSDIIHSLAAAMLDWEDGTPLQAVSTPSGRHIAPVEIHSQLSPNQLPDAMDEDDTSPIRDAKSPMDESTVTLSATSNECIPVEMQGSNLADMTVRTYVKHISETASAGVFSSVTHVASQAGEPRPGWCASKAFSRPVMHGLFADSAIAAGTFITEFRGELYSADAYRNNSINQFAALGATKPHVHLFPPPLNLAIDARRFGTEARFARFSCHPNAVLRPILFKRRLQDTVRSHTSSRTQSPIPYSKHSADLLLQPDISHSDEPELLFGLFAIADIPRTHEVTLGWEWDDTHIVHFLPELVRNPCMLPSRHHDLDRHTDSLVALAEKGDFPYAYTEFSTKMQTVAAALLGSVLCSCIGSAAPPGGGGGASSNNGRKQDCAVAQMLRVGHGMSLLNVPMPGKPNRRAKLPDFTPLVGIRRHWRTLDFAPTPDVSVKDHGSGSSALDSEEHGDSVLALHKDQLGSSSSSTEDLVCGATTYTDTRFDRSRQAATANLAKTRPNERDEDDDDARSVASSLTDALSGLSYDDNSSADEDVELTRALRLADGFATRPIHTAQTRTSQQGPDHAGLFLLPPKKRSLRTRIKVLRSPSSDGNEDSPNETDSVRSGSRRSSANSIKVPAMSKNTSVNKRKTVRVPSRLGKDLDSDGEDSERRTAILKKRRKSGTIVDPSSPLSSVVSPPTDRASTSPILGPHMPSKHRDRDARRPSDLKSAQQKRAARHAKELGSKRLRKEKDNAQANLKKREQALSHRQDLLGLTQSETSDTSDGSRSSVRTRETKENSTNITTADANREDASPSSKSGLTKNKKSRRVLSDSESSVDDDNFVEMKQEPASVSSVKAGSDAQTRSEPHSSPHEEAGLNLEVSRPGSVADVVEKEIPADLRVDAVIGDPTNKTQDVEVKKEEPRVKLSLAEYKRRLAERRVSEKQQEPQMSASTETPRSTELDAQSPSVHRGPPGSLSARNDALSPPAIPAVSQQAPNVLLESKPSPATIDSARRFLFTSTSAPTAIRSVEIPKSPSPEPERPGHSDEAPASIPTAKRPPASETASIAPIDPAKPSVDAVESIRAGVEGDVDSVASLSSYGQPYPAATPTSPASLTVPSPAADNISHRPPPSPSAVASSIPTKAPHSLLGTMLAASPPASSTGSTMPSSTFETTFTESGPSLPRYAAARTTSPSASPAFGPGANARDYAGAPRGPASMRDPVQATLPSRDAWADARDPRDYAGGRAPGVDHSYGDPRELAWNERERLRWERENPHRDPRDIRSTSRDDREMAASSYGNRPDYHHQPYPPHAHQYRRPSMSEYEEHGISVGLPYDRSSDPYGRGTMGQARDGGRDMRDYREMHDYRNHREYDFDLGGVPQSSQQHAYGPRGGYRGGWGGGSRSRGRGMPRGGGGRGGWSR